MFTTTKVEDYRPVPGKANEVRLVAENHYVRVKQGGHEPLFIQGGHVYADGGHEVTDLPAWFHEEVKNINPSTLEVVKYAPKPAPKVK